MPGLSRPDSSLEELEETTPAGAVSFLVPGYPASPLQPHQISPSLISHSVPVLKTAQVTPCLQLIQSVRLRPVAATDPGLPKSPSKGNTHPGLKSPRLQLMQASPWLSELQVELGAATLVSLC